MTERHVTYNTFHHYLQVNKAAEIFLTFRKDPLAVLETIPGEGFTSSMEPAQRPDIVILKLERPFDLTENVKPACLPTKPFEPDTICFASGWGRNPQLENFTHPFLNSELQAVASKVLDNNKCQKILSDFYSTLIVIRVVVFSSKGYKIRKISA